MEKIKGRSTEDINALGAPHIKGAFFFSRRLFEWDICSFSLTMTLRRVAYNFTLNQLEPLLLDLCLKLYWIPNTIENFRFFFLGRAEGGGEGGMWMIDRYPFQFCNLTLLSTKEGRRICYRYPAKVYNSTLLSFRVFHVRATCEFDWNPILIENFRSSGGVGGTILGGGRLTIIHFQSSLDYGIIKWYGFQEHSSNTYTRIHNYN